MKSLVTSGEGETDRILQRARAELVRIAASIGGLSAGEGDPLDLLEAERSIHNAVVALDQYGVWRHPGPQAPAMSRGFS
jgi:hypothetical protein